MIQSIPIINLYYKYIQKMYLKLLLKYKLPSAKSLKHSESKSHLASPASSSSSYRSPYSCRWAACSTQASGHSPPHTRRRSRRRRAAPTRFAARQSDWACRASRATRSCSCWRRCRSQSPSVCSRTVTWRGRTSSMRCPRRFL